MLDAPGPETRQPPLGPAARLWIGFFATLLVLMVGSWLWQEGLVQGFARERQAKANLLALQTALERYAVDHDGSYPHWLNGQGQSGPNNSPWGLVFNPYCEPFCGDGDPLLLWGYLSYYPNNPFVSKSLAYDLLPIAPLHATSFSIPPLEWRGLADHNGLLWIWQCNGGAAKCGREDLVRVEITGGCWSTPTSYAYGGGSGGRSLVMPAQSMFNVTEGSYGCGPEGERLGPYLSRGWSGHPPPPPLLANDGSVNCTTQICQTKRRYQRAFMPGNFYYSPSYLGTSNAWGVWVDPPTGYDLVVYGAPGNRGMDVYDEAGDFASGTHYCEGDGLADTDGDGLRDCRDADNPLHNGPDGVPDGVILHLTQQNGPCLREGCAPPEWDEGAARAAYEALGLEWPPAANSEEEPSG